MFNDKLSKEWAKAQKKYSLFQPHKHQITRRSAQFIQNLIQSLHQTWNQRNEINNSLVNINPYSNPKKIKQRIKFIFSQGPDTVLLHYKFLFTTPLNSLLNEPTRVKLKWIQSI